MTTNTCYAQAYSPCFPREEQGEWVWVPKNTVPGLPVTPHQSPMYRSFSASSSQASQSTMPWTASPCSPAHSPVGYHVTSVSSGSPAEPLLEGFDMDMAFCLNTQLGDVDPSWAFPVADSAASMDLFTNGLDAELFPGLDGLDGLDFSLGTEGVNPYTPPNTLSPASSVYDTFTLPAGNTSPPTLPIPPSPPTTNNSPASTSPQTKQLLPCSETSCNKVFTSRSDLRKHERKHRQPFRCPLPECAKGHLDKRALARHLWAKHPTYAQQSNTRSERVKCPCCEYEGRRDNVARHMKRHGR